jgi:hypothetical protein
MKTAKGLKYAGFGVLGVAAVFLFTYLVMLLWNALVPGLFKGPELNYWQTMGVFVLAKILFSGMGGGRQGSKSGHVRKYRDHEDYPRSKWRQKYEAKMNGKVEEGSSEENVETETDQ